MQMRLKPLLHHFQTAHSLNGMLSTYRQRWKNHKERTSQLLVLWLISSDSGAAGSMVPLPRAGFWPKHIPGFKKKHKLKPWKAFSSLTAVYYVFSRKVSGDKEGLMITAPITTTARTCGSLGLVASLEPVVPSHETVQQHWYVSFVNTANISARLPNPFIKKIILPLRSNVLFTQQLPSLTSLTA